MTKQLLKVAAIFFAILVANPSLVLADETLAPTPPKQENEKQTSPLSIYADLKSRHTWRGKLTVSGFNIQPNLVYQKSNFTLGAWGCYALDNSYAEVDLYASYKYKFLKFTVADYFCPNETVKFNNYFNWDKINSPHTIDIELKFTGTEKLPIYLLASTMVFGNRDENNKEKYSTYLEAGYTVNFTNYNQTLDFFIGATPFDNSYGDGFNVVNLGMKATKNFIISEKFNLPVYSKIIVNPNTENIYLVFGVTI